MHTGFLPSVLCVLSPHTGGPVRRDFSPLKNVDPTGSWTGHRTQLSRTRSHAGSNPRPLDIKPAPRPTTPRDRQKMIIATIVTFMCPCLGRDCMLLVLLGDPSTCVAG
jgi:hypothetical protein